VTNLESPRLGYVFRGMAVFWWLFALADAVALPIVHAPLWLLPFNVVTVIAGVSIWRSGTRYIRGAREHHQFMERHRAFLAEWDLT
jgi:hypothetical protein